MGLKVNIKTKLVTIGSVSSFNIKNESFEVANNVCLIGLTIKRKGISSQKRHHKVAFATKTLRKLFGCRDVFIPIKKNCAKNVSL